MFNAIAAARRPKKPATQGQRPSPNSRRTDKLDALRDWKPSVSHPSIRREVTLRSVYAQRLVNVTFFRAQIGIYQVSVLLPIFTSQEDGAKFNTMLHEQLDKHRTELREEIERLKKMRDDNGVDVGTVEYTEQHVESIPLYTPEAGIFLGLLTSFDELVTMTDMLWLSGALQHIQRDNCIHFWRSRLLTFANELNTLQARANSAMQRHQQLKTNALVAKELARKKRRETIGSEAAAGVHNVTDTSHQEDHDLPAPITDSKHADDLASIGALTGDLGAADLSTEDGEATPTAEEAKPKRSRKKAAPASDAMAA